MSDKKRCLMCGEPVAQQFQQPSERMGRTYAKVFARSISISVLDPRRHFCRLRCAAAFGVLAAEAGYRKVKP